MKDNKSRHKGSSETRYSKERFGVEEAQHRAEEIAFAPVVFQASRLMLKHGIFAMLREAGDGLTLDEIADKSGLSRYAVQVLAESSLTAGTILQKEDRYLLSKVGWFLLTDEMAKVNMDFVEDVNYLGLFHLDEAIEQGKPAGLKTFGPWDTIYQGLSQLPEEAKRSWFAFDHYYSDNAFNEALDIILARPIHSLLDVGGNTGKFARRCVNRNEEMEVSVFDLPQQLKMLEEQNKKEVHANRIHGIPGNVLEEATTFPKGFDAIWMSQFLDCFSEPQVKSILLKAAAAMDDSTSLYIMETLWDKQHFETASFCLAQISLYFTAMANGNSKMFRSDDLFRLIDAVGLKIASIHEGLGLGHTLIECKKQ